MEKRIIAAFDFDGTITTKDTLLEFIKFVKGNKAFYIGFLRFSPFIISYKLKLYPNWKAKQKIFNHFFGGMKYHDFRLEGERFSDRLDSMIRPKALEAINEHLKNKNTIYVISASITEWVSPFCKRIGITNTLGTEIEVDDQGFLTGKFLSSNCYGPEKVNRLLEKEPDRDSYTLYAYGDSKGDKNLIEFADKGWYNKFKETIHSL
jgi:HAD superfamily hydrolase (TIGR01490 family)